MTGALLEVRGLERRFGATTALAGVDLALERGEVVALLGENGAGKSTLVEIVGGSLRADAGAISLDGRRYSPRDPRQARSAGVAVVHQHFQLVEAFTVEENLALWLAGSPRAELARRREALERALGLPLPPSSVRVASLGVGQRQWVEVARALLGRPRLLLLDEATAALTPGEAERLFATVRRLREQGTGVLVITHRLDEVRQVADRVLVLRRGAMVAELPADAPTSELAAAMVGELPAAAARADGGRGVPVARLSRVAVPPKLEPLDLELRSGEVVVLAGVDGNGQIEVAERLAGLGDGPGRIEIGGRWVRRADPTLMRRLGVVVIPSDRTREGIVARLSVAENLALGTAHRFPLRPAELERAAAAAIERFAIAGRAAQPAGELSGGNQQKLVVARALTGSPRVVVAMHPSRGLDVAAQRGVRELLLEAASAGAGVLLVTADLDEARELADRILVFSHGRVVGEGDRTTPGDRLARWVGGEAA